MVHDPQHLCLETYYHGTTSSSSPRSLWTFRSRGPIYSGNTFDTGFPYFEIGPLILLVDSESKVTRDLVRGNESQSRRLDLSHRDLCQDHLFFITLYYLRMSRMEWRGTLYNSFQSVFPGQNLRVHTYL